MKFDNIAGIHGDDMAVGEALVEFGKMIEDGRAAEQRLPTSLRPVSGGIPAYRDSDFPAHDAASARESIRRARSQHEKGPVSGPELARIVARCRQWLAGLPEGG